MLSQREEGAANVCMLGKCFQGGGMKEEKKKLERIEYAFRRDTDYCNLFFGFEQR
jgi:hypothetical protein